MRLPADRFASRDVLSRCTIAVLTMFIAACASTPVVPTRTSYGWLTDQSGLTLYTFDRDTAGSGKSVCNGPCAANWPAFAAPVTAAETGDYTIVVRDDGSRQWALKGLPLYTYSRDGKPGEKSGDGALNNQWHVARP